MDDRCVEETTNKKNKIKKKGLPCSKGEGAACESVPSYRYANNEKGFRNFEFRFRKLVVLFLVAIQYRLFAHGTERKTGVAKLDPWSEN